MTISVVVNVMLGLKKGVGVVEFEAGVVESVLEAADDDVEQEIKMMNKMRI